MLSQLFARKEGVSVLEVAVSVAVMAIGATTLVVMSNTVIRGSDDARSRTVANQYVREALEYSRSQRDNNSFNGFFKSAPVSFSSTAGIKYFSMPSSGALTGATPAGLACGNINSATYQIPGTKFYRAVKMDYVPSGSMEHVTVTALVCYDFRNGQFRSDSATTILSNWK
jgi:Tfp pilus assembly protein PilV